MMGWDDGQVVFYMVLIDCIIGQDLRYYKLNVTIL